MDKKGFIGKLYSDIGRLLEDKAAPHPPGKGFLRKGLLGLAVGFLVLLPVTCRLITW